MQPEELFQTIKNNFDKANPKDEKEAYLLKLVEFYKPLEVYDEQTRELFRWGTGEENLWQVNL